MVPIALINLDSEEKHLSRSIYSGLFTVKNLFIDPETIKEKRELSIEII